MEELIRRSDAIKALKREKSDWNNDYNVPIDHCIERLNKVKSADRPQGEWIYTDNPLRLDDEWACSRCGNISFARTNFCDRCGARMKGADDE